MTMRNLLIVAAFAFAIAACASTQQQPPAPQVVYRTQTVDTGCQWAKLIAIRTADAATLPDDVARQILAHDREWSKRCAGTTAAVPPAQ